MLKYKFILGALTLAGLASAGSALAATANASLSNVHLRVVDLDPLDGITASATFVSGLMLSSAYFNPDGNTPVYNYDSGPLGWSASYQIGIPGTSASSQVFAGDLFIGIGPGAAASATTVGQDHRASAAGQGYELKFSVTPNTLLIVTADTPTATISLITGEYASAAAVLNFRSTDGSINSTAQAYVYQSTSGFGQTITPGSLQTSFVNLANSATEINLNFYASADVGSIAAAVPEPSSAALAALGLVVVGGALRRARRR